MNDDDRAIIKRNNKLPDGWYAGPFPDEVYYLSRGLWMTSHMRAEGTPPYRLVRIIEVPVEHD